MNIEKRIEALENKLVTPKDFSVREYLNYGAYSVITELDRMLILNAFEKQTTAKQQANLSVLFRLQCYRDELGFPLYITCGKRTKEHELQKGRSGDSVHLWGATDVTCDNEVNLQELALFADSHWVGGFSYYESQRFCHLDMGRNRRW